MTLFSLVKVTGFSGGFTQPGRSLADFALNSRSLLQNRYVTTEKYGSGLWVHARYGPVVKDDSSQL